MHGFRRSDNKSSTFLQTPSVTKAEDARSIFKLFYDVTMLQREFTTCLHKNPQKNYDKDNGDDIVIVLIIFNAT